MRKGLEIRGSSERRGSCSKLTFTKTTKTHEKKKEPQYSSTIRRTLSGHEPPRGYGSAEIGGERAEDEEVLWGEQNVRKEV